MPPKKRKRGSRRPRNAPKLPPAEAAAIRDRNLKPAAPGEVRNPTGKNGHEWRKMLRDFAAGQAVEGDDLPKRLKLVSDGDTRFDVLMKAIFRNVVMGREASQKLMFEQLAGRARQHIEIAAASNGPPVTFMLPPNGRDVEPTAQGEGDEAGGDAAPEAAPSSEE